MINKLELSCELDELIITSKTILVMTRNLNKISFVVPKLCERMLHYVNENSDVVSGETLSRLLYHLFCMGYEPNVEMKRLCDANQDTEQKSGKLLNADLFDFANFIKILNRDFDFTAAWLIVQSCLALSFYHALSIDLINRIFNMDFIVRLEKEMTINYDTVNYPKNILELVMQLNRSVCLSYPEAGIPWFQRNFIESQLASSELLSIISIYFIYLHANFFRSIIFR